MQEDAEIITRALKETGLTTEIIHVGTAGKAMDYLKGDQPVQAIVSDVHINGMMETSYLVDAMKNSKDTEEIPVVLTSILPPDSKTEELMGKYPELKFVSKDQEYEMYKNELFQVLAPKA